MKKNTRKSSKPTLSVDYTPELKAAADEVRKAGQAYQRHARTGDEKVLPQCVTATRHALESGYLVDGRDKDAAPGSITGKAYAAKFGLSSGSEVTFWKRLSRALMAGVEIGDDIWVTLATNGGIGSAPLAKNSEVASVIDDGGSVEAIRKVCEQVQAQRDRKAATRKARPASGSDNESATVPTTDDPVKDALTALVALKSALTRCQKDGTDAAGWKRIRKGYDALGKSIPTTAAITARATREKVLPVASGQ
jgi:hypothetical protein